MNKAKDSSIIDFCRKHGGSRVRPIDNVPICGRGIAKIKAGVPYIIAAQRIILKELLGRYGEAEILKKFGIPKQLSPWIPVLRNPNHELMMMRADILVSRDGQHWLCELNVDSSVGGGEASEFLKIEEKLNRKSITETPLDHLVQLISKLLLNCNGKKVCIFDWSTWAGYGLFDLEWLRVTLSEGLPGVDVFTSNEKDGVKNIDKKPWFFDHFSHRMF